MTPDRQPQQEYIITMGRIIKARNMLMVDGYHNADVLDRMVNLLRARPHTSPPAPATIIGKQTHEAFEDAKFLVFVQGTAAKAEREQVLDAIDEWLNSDDHLSLYKWEVREKIRSLRHTTKGGEQE